jgi:coenzyme F420-0:L-glutamate ligase / coenzyme F420-1:gamma-L-glutamate ligase
MSGGDWTESDPIFARRSIRRYGDESIPATLVTELVEAACRAPSPHNRQPWRFAVLTTADRKLALAHAMGERLTADRRADGDDEAAVAADVARSHRRITAAPVVLVACLSMADMDAYPDARRRAAERAMAAQAVAAAVQNLMLAATARGLASCWMCAPLFCPEVVRSVLDLAQDWEPQALITLGYAADAGRLRPRHRPDAVMRWL